VGFFGFLFGFVGADFLVVIRRLLLAPAASRHNRVPDTPSFYHRALRSECARWVARRRDSGRRSNLFAAAHHRNCWHDFGDRAAR
jgi:hypothetical protein